MVMQKRKAVCERTDSVIKACKAAAASKTVAEEEPEMDVEAEEEEEVESEEPEQVVSEEKLQQKREQELVAARKKELKATSADKLKQFVLDRGLEAGNRDANIEKLLKAEAKERKAQREHQATLRAIVNVKKDELEALSASDLAKQCTAMNVTGVKAKQARVEYLLKLWQENDGVDKALKQRAYDARKAELLDTDSPSLVRLCNKMGIDAFVTEVMAHRVLKREVEADRFNRPVAEEEAAAAAPKKAGNMVDELLAKEANRKKQKEQKQKEDEEAASKLKGLSTMAIADLKKQLEKKGLEASGKKDELVRALFAVFEADRKLKARTVELQAFGKEGLKELCVGKKLSTSQKKEEMVKSLLEHEAQLQKELKAHEVMVEEIIVQNREALMQKSNADLKDMLAAKGLKVGMAKEERVDRLLEDARKPNGEVDAAVALKARDARQAQLLAMEKAALRKLCEEMGADPIVREVVVERILDAEATAAEVPPSAKRAKK